MDKKGFSLVELMIVVAIVGILASVAIPFYQRYVSKSRMVSLVLPATHAIENNISTYYACYNRKPRISDDADLTRFSGDADTHFLDIRYTDWESFNRLTVVVKTDAVDPRDPSGTHKPFHALGNEDGRNVFHLVAEEQHGANAEQRLYWSYQGTLVTELGLR